MCVCLSKKYGPIESNRMERRDLVLFGLVGFVGLDVIFFSLISP